MRPLLALPIVALLILPAPASGERAREASPSESAVDDAAESAVDDAAEAIARASEALGGASGAGAALAALGGYRMGYAMEVHDPMTGKDYAADHVYTRGVDGAVDLQVTVTSGKGVDSTAHAGADGGWVQAGEERSEMTSEEVLLRVRDFSAEELFRVPLDLAGRGIDSLPEEVRGRLELGGGATERPDGEDDGPRPVVVRALDDQGEEQLRLEFDPATWHLLEATFRSVAGRITYRFGGYREVAPGLWLPATREFLRDGIRLSALAVTSFEVLPLEGSGAPGDGGGETGGETGGEKGGDTGGEKGGETGGETGIEKGDETGGETGGEKINP